ncbi:hypothetical protein [Oryza sativa Japonica Group]|uniref:Uncharacterized protein n=1 Tax=Oryza sativa subsp. japonica TaxID=39947 RepID=Q5NBB7_ORYSJ|nr:hypothetical protein [Oryza sativa Japonica Group]
MRILNRWIALRFVLAFLTLALASSFQAAAAASSRTRLPPPPPHAPSPGLAGWPEGVNGAGEPPSPLPRPASSPTPYPPLFPNGRRECPRPAIFPVSDGFPPPYPSPLATAS